MKKSMAELQQRIKCTQQAGGKSFTHQSREGTRNTAATLDAHGPPRPQGGIRIMEGCETRPPRNDAASSKGKEKSYGVLKGSSIW